MSPESVLEEVTSHYTNKFCARINVRLRLNNYKKPKFLLEIKRGVIAPQLLSPFIPT